MIRRITIFFGIIFFCNTFFIQNTSATSLDLKIPFLSGEEWKITQGYDGDGWGSGKPTHNSSSKDRFALDFSLSGESDYNKQVLAVADGIVSIKESKVVNKITGVVEYTGYGKYVDIDHGDDIISRYAHFVNFAVEDGEIVKQGQLIGYLDSTGYSSGSHLHFAMYQKDANGNLTPYKPEPMSGYTDFKAGEWYVSDNELYDPNKKVEESTEQPQQKSWWQKVKEVFSFGDGDVNSENTQELKDVFQNTNQNLEFEIKTAEAEKTYSLNFLNSNQTIEIEPGGESNLQVKVKNVGTATWEKKNISANVVGGLSANNEYHHQTWVTSLRPALLDQNTLEPNQSGSFSFKINAPTKPGQYTFKIQVVRTDNNFSPVSGGYWSVNLQVKEKELVIENKVEKEVKENIEIKKDSGIKIIEEVKEVFNNVKETVKEFFYSSGSSSSGSSNNNQDESQSDSNNENLPEVFIISPTSSKYTNISTATISGTKNEFTEFVYINTTTANIISSTTWEKEINLGEGSNSFQIWGENEEGKKTDTNIVEIILDKTAPVVSKVSLTQTDFVSNTLYADWQAEDSGIGISFYDAEYSINGGDWLVWATSTISTGFSLPGEKLNKYNLRVKAYDLLNNVSDWAVSNEVAVDWSKEVVINEVAWMGTGASANQKADEWLELYNNTNNDIDLTGWQILIDDKPLVISKIINPIIPAQGYLLLERTDDNAVVNLVADMFFTGAIDNVKGKIVLKNNLGEIIDEVDCGGGWFAGSIENNQYRSMARVDTSLPGSWSNNWQTSIGIDPVTKPAGGGNIFGSPKRGNKGGWLLKGLNINYSSQFENNTWNLKVENSPYLIDYKTEIPAGFTLQVEPGVILYGLDKSSYIQVNGNLVLVGEQDKPIIFTSGLDRDFVTENLSTLYGEPAPGDWSRISINPGGSLVANYTKFLYGGAKFFIQGGFVFGGKYVSRVINNVEGLVDINNSEFKENYIGFDEDNLLYDSVVWTEASESGSASTTVSNSYFEHGLVAIRDRQNINSSSRLYQRIVNNTFSDFISEKGAIQSGKSQLEVESNTFINGTSNILFRDVWNLEKDETLKDSMEYYFGSIDVPVGVTLFIDPGVKIKMKSGDITVHGILKAMGTVDEPISISNQVGFGWSSLKFINSTSSLNYVQISKGGYRPVSATPMVMAENSNLIFDNVSLSNPSNYHSILYLKNSTTSLLNSNLFRDNFDSDSEGIEVDGGSLILDNVVFNGFGKGIKVLRGGILNLNNMNEENFQNILTYKWWPETAWSFASST